MMRMERLIVVVFILLTLAIIGILVLGTQP